MIDTHCHLTFPELAPDVPGLLDEARAAGVSGVITICTTTRNGPEVLAVARRYPNVWCSAGVHPLYADDGPHEWDVLRRCIVDERCVAWGELGLDNHYAEPARDLQRRVLDEHLALIAECRSAGIDKPIVLHCREAFDDLIPVLRASGIPGERFVFHCFTGGLREMGQVLDLGAMVSFTGVVTYPSAKDLHEAARLAPLDRIMLETDAPFLSPVPHRGKRPCRPAWVRHTAEGLASLRGEAFDDFHAAINANTTRFFGIPTHDAGAPRPGGTR
ncbi:MAG: TatD family hydrolase [Phycisphaeraceae bacterium]|nr:TatD family hydrolase [Phycisphaeraceae bacterium]